jgi:hypothetical protein
MYTLIFRGFTAVLEGRDGAAGAVTLFEIGVGAVAPTDASRSVEEIEAIGTEAAASTTEEDTGSALTAGADDGTTES